jgi:hypothetical protein
MKNLTPKNLEAANLEYEVNIGEMGEPTKILAFIWFAFV